ncbi:proto-oncogene Mas-like [Heteronotia binoei]|uniref:proto-oncogene Mas-like n=1 Tax=Heteronotia binoei TaxID=13085 RepID=UPI00292E995A|nr:proto-oncogene Mas-like [Heteronotia binoei]
MPNTSTATIAVYATTYNSTGSVHSPYVYGIITCLLTLLCSLFGLVGNGKVIWILAFCRLSNPFTTYILNLGVADFGTLLSLSARAIILLIPWKCHLVNDLVFALIFFTYSTSLYFLTVISMERCFSVMFPIWYRCHRPEKSSAVVSLLLWIISGLLSGTLWVFDNYLSTESLPDVLGVIFTLNLLILTPIMVVSTLIMSIKICCSTQRRQPPRLYTAILVTLLFFIVFAIPLSVSYFIFSSYGYFLASALQSSYLFASFNSSINPVIYYFVGRNRKKRRESLKVVFKRVFRDDAISPGGT